jgi:uncharacterized damage-inducible protein DinB
MKEILLDLIHHQAWADAEHWKAMHAYPQSLQDEDIAKRLFHIHLVQSGFLSVVLLRPLDRKQFQENMDTGKCIVTARKNNEEFAAFLDGADSAQLERIVNVPWFKDPPMNLPVSQALIQVSMHSQYHRGQNARRLREIGGTPPTTDFIVWEWKGKPQAAWQK